MKGIILAGGAGSRLFPATCAVSKQLLPIFDKPMIYYPLATLMLAGIREILIISTPEDRPRFEKLFSDGSHLGLKIQYQIQEKPEGIGQAFILGKEFIGDDSVALILGDNIFYGHDLVKLLRNHTEVEDVAIIFGYRVKDPSRYGVAEFDDDFRVVGIEEKPVHPKSNYAICGLYMYDSSVVQIAETITPSKRGELEITDINLAYLQKNKLKINLLGRGFAWLDTGTFEALHSASFFVQTIQERQGVKIACIEEIAFRMGYISRESLLIEALKYPNEYGYYLKTLASESDPVAQKFSKEAVLR